MKMIKTNIIDAPQPKLLLLLFVLSSNYHVFRTKIFVLMKMRKLLFNLLIPENKVKFSINIPS